MPEVAQAPGGTGTHGSRDTGSQPSWGKSKKDSVEAACLTTWHLDAPGPTSPASSPVACSPASPVLAAGGTGAPLGGLRPFLLALGSDLTSLTDLGFLP